MSKLVDTFILKRIIDTKKRTCILKIIISDGKKSNKYIYYGSNHIIQIDYSRD